jgi:chorismate synthase
MGSLRFLTAGESHGQALGAIVEGVPAGLALTAGAIDTDLARRQRGYGRGARQAIEQDRAEILSGVRHGRTLGSPILLLVRNRDWENWTRVMQVEPLSDKDAAQLARPGPAKRDAGHAGQPGMRPRRRAQIRLHDIRNVLERASARETAAHCRRRRARAFRKPRSTSGRSPPRSAGSVDPPAPAREEGDASPCAARSRGGSGDDRAT